MDKDILEDLKNDPKVDILHTFKGLSAVNKVKQIEFKYDTEEATKWANHWTVAEKKRACLIIYSRLQRVNKDIRYKFIIGDSILGSKYTYAKGMKMIDSLL